MIGRSPPGCFCLPRAAGFVSVELLVGHADEHTRMRFEAVGTTWGDPPDPGEQSRVPTELLRTLVRAALASNDAMNLAEVRIRSTSGSMDRWNACLRSMRTHRLCPIGGYAIERCGSDMVPEAPRRELQTAYRDSLLTNTGLLRILDDALRALREKGIEPVVRGGVVFAEVLYPTVGARAVRNVDLAIPPDAFQSAVGAVESTGLRRLAVAAADGAYTFADRSDTTPTAVPCIRLVPIAVPDEAREMIEPVHLRAETMCVLEPNALVVHLVRGMDARRPITGYLLSALLDLAFTFRGRSDALNQERIGMFASNEEALSIARAARFLEVNFGVATPAGLVDGSRRTIAFSLDDLIVAGRITPWELSTVGGWVRLGASRMAVRRTDQEMPQLRDLMRWPGLARRERRQRLEDRAA